MLITVRPYLQRGKCSLGRDTTERRQWLGDGRAHVPYC